MVDLARFHQYVEGFKQLIKRGQTGSGFIEKTKRIREEFEQVKKHEGLNRKTDELLYLKIKCLLIESYYIVDKIEESRLLLEEDSDIYTEIISGPRIWLDGKRPLDYPARKILREKIRFCLDYAQTCLYHTHDYGQAESVIKTCIDIARQITMPRFHCDATLAQATYYLARVFRQNHKYDDAEMYFGHCLEHYHERIDRKQKAFASGNNSQWDLDKLNEDIAFSRYRSAVCLGLGIGWLNYAKGSSKTALYSNILPARVILAQTQDVLNKAYLELMDGAIRRSLNPDSEATLNSSLAKIKHAHDEFKSMKHQRYQSRANYEIALVYAYISRLHKQKFEKELQEQNIELASSHLDKVISYSENRDDWRWVSQAYTLKSQLVREKQDNDKAIELASSALEFANRGKTHRTHTIEALLARGKAYIYSGYIDKALVDLEQALSLNRDDRVKVNEPVNPKLEAVGYYNLTLAWVKKENIKESKANYELAQRFSGGIEDAIVSTLEREAHNAIRSLETDSFTVTVTQDLNMKKNVDNLRTFLKKTALSITGNNQAQAAKLLGKNRSNVNRRAPSAKKKKK